MKDKEINYDKLKKKHDKAVRGSRKAQDSLAMSAMNNLVNRKVSGTPLFFGTFHSHKVINK